MKTRKILISLFAGLVGATLLSASAMAKEIEINNAQDLAEYAEDVNTAGYDSSDDVVTLKADIDLEGVEWTPIGTGARNSATYTGNAFKGIFDGNDKTISNLTISDSQSGDAVCGFFGIVSEGTVKDLNFVDASITSNATNTGVAVGLACDGAVISGITVGTKNDNSVVNCPDGAAGVVGRLCGSGSVIDCTNYADVISTSTGGGVGGVIGKAYRPDSATSMSVEECVNYGDVECGYAAGGVVGLSATNVIDCENYGTVTAGVEAGGIVGEQNNPTSASLYVTGNKNSGEVIVTAPDKFGAGGIIGQAKTGTVDAEIFLYVTGNENRGDILVEGTATGANATDAGGIVGYLYMTDAIVSENENYAENIVAAGYAGGIVGLIYKHTDGNTTGDDVTVNNNVNSTENVSAVGNSNSDTHIITNNTVKFFTEANGEKYTTLAVAIEYADDKSVIKLLDDVVLTETAVIPEGKTLTIDLAGNSISMAEDIKTTTYAIANLGTLTLKDSEGEGSVSSRGIYNGFDGGTNYCYSAEITIVNGTYNALGTNGGAAVYNYGTANINGGDFTSIGSYSLNSQSGASMTIADGITANNGIYCSGATLVVNGGEITGNRSGCHVLYAWNSDVTINGGEFYNYNSGNATIMIAGTSEAEINGGTFGIQNGKVPGDGNTWTSCLLDTANTATMEINDGTFNGGFRVQAGTKAEINGGSFNDIYGSAYNIYGTVEIKGGLFTDTAAKTFAGKYLASGYTTTKYENDVLTVVKAEIIGNTSITVEFEEVLPAKEGEKLYNINLVASTDKVINRLNSVDLTFVLTQSLDADNNKIGKNVYEIIAFNEEIVINPVDNSTDRYEFHYNGKDGVKTDTGAEITIGQVKFTGYGKFNFAVDTTATTNAAHATEALDNIVDTFVPNGSADGLGDLVIDGAKVENVLISVPTRDLVINVAFPNSVKTDNNYNYQAMKVVVSGGDLAEAIVVDLGANAVMPTLTTDVKTDAAVSVATTDKYVVTLTDALTVNTSYNVEVSGAGYRTARYTVTMNCEDYKTLNFWNNVKDNDTLVEEKKDSSAKKVTFLAGDIVKDSVINIYDLSAVVSYFGEIDLNKSGEYNAYAKYDLNRDGKIDSKDVAYVLVSWGK